MDHSRGLTDTRSAAVAVGRADGSVSLLNPCTGLEYWRVPAQAPGDKAATLRGVHFLHSSPAAEPALPPHVLSCTHGGTARIHGWQGEVSADATELASWSVPANVCCTALDAARGLLAVGAQGTELRLFDVATGAAAFVGKGGRPNKVGLMDRPWNTAAAFMPGSNGTKLAVGTGEHKFRLYDTAAGKRPQLDIVFGQARVTAVAPEADGEGGEEEGRGVLRRVLLCFVQFSCDTLDVVIVGYFGGFAFASFTALSVLVCMHAPLHPAWDQ